MSEIRKRDVWIDNVKAIACILVALGHFFPSLIIANILDDNDFFECAKTALYDFHVQLFFICSGYLYQKYSTVVTLEMWKKNIFKKLVVLGVPYFFFSLITWILKNVFASSVNNKTEGLLVSLFINPIAPYWYLYILFILFLITFTCKGKREILIIFSLSFASKLCDILGISFGLYAVDMTMYVWIWFVLGMILAMGLIKPMASMFFSVLMLLAFIICSVLVYYGVIGFRGDHFLLGIMACYSIISMVYKANANGKQMKYWGEFTKYTMPIFLLHTIFAAPLRILLLKVGLTNVVVHVLLGLVITFAGPIIAMKIMELLKPLDFLVYPNRYFYTSKS